MSTHLKLTEEKEGEEEEEKMAPVCLVRFKMATEFSVGLLNLEITFKKRKQ